MYNQSVNILSIENLEKTLKDEPLFEGATLGLEDGEKAGIVGRNGAGKSTFLKTVMGILTPDEGKVSQRAGTDMAYLEQAVSFSGGATVRSYLYESSARKIQTLLSYRKALDEEDERKYQHLYEMIEKEGLWDIEHEYLAILESLGEKIDPDRTMASLSGGQQKKAAIARILAIDPDILLLDEPTNHLDIRSIEYLEAWIKSSSKAVIIVTHDRHILNECCTTIWELDRKRFYRHPGSFTSYLERREERLRMAEKEMARIETILRREREWLMRGPKARTGKDKNRKERIEEMEGQLGKVREDRQRSFSSLDRRMGKKVLDVESISKGYDGTELFSGFTFSFQKGQRIGVIGDNGTGKSTLLDILTGRIEPDSGTVDKGVNTFFGYYDQLGRNLVSEKPMIEYAEDIGKRVMLSDGEDVSASRFLELFGFPVSMQRLPISTLSGGERRRLYLITRLLSNPNFLVLDEPTNDLDLETMENLESYILSFPGTVLISSHDRTFLDLTVDMLLVIEGRRITLFPGSYSEWKERRDSSRAEAKETEKAQPEERRPRERKGLSYKEKKEKEGIEARMEELEALIQDLEASFSTPGDTELGTLRERTDRYGAAKAELEGISERWLELAEKEEG